MPLSRWISEKVSGLLPEPGPPRSTHERRAGPFPSKLAPQPTGRRLLDERLGATLRRGDEALSPRALRLALGQLRAIIDPQVSEAEGGLRAKAMASWYAAATPQQRRDLCLLMSEQFVADPAVAKAAQAAMSASLGSADEAAAEVRYRRATVSPRRRLLQRFSAFDQGVRFLVDVRAELLPALKHDKRLHALDAEMEYMFSTWFDVGFLELRRISWDSPASLIEKLIRYEAVHDIKSWADVKNRLDSDRRCYGFFHPRLPDEPLIFVEVALLDHMADSVAPLLDESADHADLNKATTAIFYSINNTQAGLRGVSFGDSLIKRVVDSLKLEFPRLKCFATLSPIPGFRSWLNKNLEGMLERLDDKTRASLARDLRAQASSVEQVLATPQQAAQLKDTSPVRKALLQFAAHYLVGSLHEGRPVDPVARFHLGNGARVERINWAADPSAKGHKQSFGLMVNYLYDLKKLDRHRARLALGKVPLSSAMEALKL